MEWTHRRRLAGFWGVAGAIAAVIFFSQWLQDRRAVARAQTWPVVDGKIESFKKWRHERGRVGHKRVTVGFDISYSFKVNGASFTGDRYLAAEGSSLFGFLGQDLPSDDRYAEGRPCVVHYDPGNPADCCLVAEAPGATTLRLLAALLGAGIAVGSFWSIYR